MRQARPIDRDADATALEDRVVVADLERGIDAIAQARAAGRLDAEAHGHRSGVLLKLLLEMPCGGLAQADQDCPGGYRKCGLRCRAAQDLDLEISASDDRLT